jgi:hypothetical protein
MVANRAKPQHHSQSCNRSTNTLRNVIGKMRFDMSSQDEFWSSSSVEQTRGWITDAEEFEDYYPLGSSVWFGGSFAEYCQDDWSRTFDGVAEWWDDIRVTGSKTFMAVGSFVLWFPFHASFLNIEYILTNVLPTLSFDTLLNTIQSIQASQYALRSQNPRPCGPDLQKHTRNSKILQFAWYETRSIPFVKRCTRSREVWYPSTHLLLSLAQMIHKTNKTTTTDTPWVSAPKSSICIKQVLNSSPKQHSQNPVLPIYAL